MASRLLPLALAASAAASAIPQARSDNVGFVTFPISYNSKTRPVYKRDSEVTLYNVSSVSYLIKLSIGTPGQDVKVAIDTGSDELWVNPDCTDPSLVSDQVRECEADGKYSSSSSSTSKVTSDTNDIPYGIGEVKLKYVTDNIALADGTGTIKAAKFGVATATDELNEGILGLGFGNGKNLDYEGFVDSLASQNVTNTKAFSVALGSVNAANGGVIIFGGVDTKKFTGQMVSNPILGPQGNEDLYRYWVEMTAVALNINGKSTTLSSSSTPVVLDSGSSLSYLPGSVVKSLATSFNGQYDSSSQLYQVPCSSASQSGDLDFTFGGVTIKVPFTEFIWQADAQTCFLGAAPSEGTGVTALLGDSFLRSAYVVFDQSQGTISMAQYANCGQNEKAIAKGGVGNVTGECNTSAKSDARSAYGQGSVWTAVGAAAVAQLAFFLL